MNLFSSQWKFVDAVMGKVTQEVAKMHGVNMDGDIFPEKIIEVDTTTKELFGNGEVGIILFRIMMLLNYLMVIFYKINNL